MPRALPYLLLLPATAFLGVFFLYPFVLVAAESLSRDGAWTLENFRRMGTHWKFPTTLRNTLVLAAVVVPVQLAMALGMASIVARLTAGRASILYIFAIPLGISDLAAGLIWLAIFEQTGFLNSALAGLGLIDRPILYLGYQNPWIIFLAIALAEIWRATAIVLIILIAGLQLIPKEFSEAAEIFGARPWTRFRKITLPLLKPSIQSALILRTVLAFEVFAVVYALGGRNFPVLAGEAYTWQNENQNYGVAAAYAVLIMAISLAATAVYLRALKVDPEQLP